LNEKLLLLLRDCLKANIAFTGLWVNFWLQST